MKTTLRACALAAVAATLLPASAIAAPVTVNLRVEGPDSTLFEGPVTTDVRSFQYTGYASLHTCDGTAYNGGSELESKPTAGAALAQAIAEGLPVTGSWYAGGGFAGPTVSTINGVSVDYDSGTGRYLTEYEDWQYGTKGICGQPVVDGTQILLAYADGSEPLLKLQVPAVLAAGATATATVTNGATGSPVEGASVGGRLTDASGHATVGPFSAAGMRSLKASKTGSIRSNAGLICVTDASGACGATQPISSTTLGGGTASCVSLGGDGRCGSTDEMAPTVRLTNLSATTYSRAQAPREVKGEVGNLSKGNLLSDPSGIKSVRLRITRYNAGKCWTYNGTAERFQRLRSCGTGKGQFFTAATSATWSYLMPAALKPGKYRVEAYAIDGLGNADRVRRWNRNHVVFRVK